MMSANANIVIVGSLNMDLVADSKRFPSEGETIIGDKFEKYPGGKGANQAVAAARLGGSVSLIGCVGDDAHGHQLKNYLEKENINTHSIFTVKDVNTGVAQISIAKKENKIIVVPGANYGLNLSMIKQSEPLIKQASVILLQLEIPMEIVAETIRIAKDNNVPVILNPAPALDIPTSILSDVSFITPNENELAILTNTTLTSASNYEGTIKLLHNKGVDHVIVTRGEKGVLFSDNKIIQHAKSNKVDVVDTTGAGDTFNGALAVALANSQSLYESVVFANKAAGISTTKGGAQTGMPVLEEVQKTN
ncbi:ribokinase [Natribacillus halophilus]|uniref:Ribokinase n=1 Tax=Natribacillus halophilus TaxID=549003 RepID=A0A1G8KEH1_9BACI|nr:ribokinase [Natribacillus halophilus]SDI41827.1 ribokinase [Natribacillus halophilus]